MDGEGRSAIAKKKEKAVLLAFKPKTDFLSAAS